MSIVCALSAIGRYILRARRPEERRRDKAKIQLYPIFAKDSVRGIRCVRTEYAERERGIRRRQRRIRRQGKGGSRGRRRIAAASGAPCRPAGMRHGTGREPGHGMDANTMAAKPEYSRLMSGNRNRGAGIRRILLPLRGRPALSLPAEAGRGKSGQHRAPRKLTT